jgi:RNA polymerase sigma-70 factor (ECF subfamily)
VRIALAEVNRRSGSTAVTGPELTDVAHQAADDAMLAILAKLKDFRGESRFITWAYRSSAICASTRQPRRPDQTRRQHERRALTPG